MDHDRALELLPWLVNGSLTGEERKQLELHVRDCIPCRNALKEQQQLAALIEQRSSVHLSAAAGFDQLMRRIEAHGHGPRRHRRFVAAWSRPRLAAAAAVVVLAAGALAAALVAERRADDASFATLGTVAPREGGRLDIIFVADISEGELRGIVRDIGGTIVAGPSEIGRYTIRVADDELSEPFENSLARLRADRRVRFAGPSFLPLEDSR